MKNLHLMSSLYYTVSCLFKTNFKCRCHSVLVSFRFEHSHVSVEESTPLLCRMYTISMLNPKWYTSIKKDSAVNANCISHEITTISSLSYCKNSAQKWSDLLTLVSQNGKFCPCIWITHNCEYRLLNLLFD